MSETPQILKLNVSYIRYAQNRFQIVANGRLSRKNIKIWIQMELLSKIDNNINFFLNRPSHPDFNIFPTSSIICFNLGWYLRQVYLSIFEGFFTKFIKTSDYFQICKYILENFVTIL